MIDTAHSSVSQPTQDQGDPALARRQRALQGLDTLAEWAMELASAFRAKALALAETAETPKDLAEAAAFGRAFDRSARTYRQCVALADRLIRQADQHKAAQVAKGLDRETKVAVRRALVRDVTAAYVETAHKGRHPESERLLADLNETLDSFDDEVFLSTAINQIARELCVSQGIVFNLGFWERVEEEGYIPHGPGYHGCHLPGEAPDDPWPPP